MTSDFWDPSDILTTSESNLLELPFTESEIHKALFDSEPNGAPGPDGFSFHFYQKFWDTIKPDLLILAHSFFDHTLNLHKLNKSCICLIPKEKGASNIKKFRPISLVNCSFKLLSKMLTNRLEHIMSRLIDPSQSAFLKNRYILDNVVLSQEIIHSCQISKQQGVIIKVDRKSVV